MVGRPGMRALPPVLTNNRRLQERLLLVKVSSKSSLEINCKLQAALVPPTVMSRLTGKISSLPQVETAPRARLFGMIISLHQSDGR